MFLLERRGPTSLLFLASYPMIVSQAKVAIESVTLQRRLYLWSRFIETRIPFHTHIMFELDALQSKRKYCLTKHLKAQLRPTE